MERPNDQLNEAEGSKPKDSAMKLIKVDKFFCDVDLCSNLCSRKMIVRVLELNLKNVALPTLKYSD